MTKQRKIPEYITREVLKEEISASEKRLEAKITGLDVKVDTVGKRLEAKFTGLEAKVDNVDKRLEAKITGLDAKVDNVEKRLEARITGLDAKVDSVERRLDAKIETTAQSYMDYTDHRFKQLDTKMTKYFELMMQTLTDGNKGINKILSNHDLRITVLEGRGPQPGKI